MSNKVLLDNIKRLREMTGVGFKDCKLALDETKGDIEKSVEFLRKKGIAKASKKMSRTASEGLALVKENDGIISLIEINSETDFVAKNQDFINFCKELSEINFKVKSKLNDLNKSKMANGITVEDNLVNLIAKIGEKITIRRSDSFDNSSGKNFFYVHSAIEKGIGKIVSVVKLEAHFSDGTKASTTTASKDENDVVNIPLTVQSKTQSDFVLEVDALDVLTKSGFTFRFPKASFETLKLLGHTKSVSVKKLAPRAELKIMDGENDSNETTILFGEKKTLSRFFTNKGRVETEYHIKSRCAGLSARPHSGTLPSASHTPLPSIPVERVE